jgi:hypothetical protein
MQGSGKLSWSIGLDLAMGSPARVAVFWDASKWRLGIAPAEEGDGFAAGAGRRYVGVQAALKMKKVWERLEFPIHMRPAALDEATGIWAISIKPDGLLFDEMVPPEPKRRKRAAPVDGDQAGED